MSTADMSSDAIKKQVSFMADILNEDYDVTDLHKIHLMKFFNALEPHYQFRQEFIKNYDSNSNTVLPQMDVSRAVMPDVFSYSGYDETASLRDQSEKNAVVARMLDESLESDPAIIIDIGTYDGVRTKSIINELKNKDNITHIIGVDKNPVVKDAFKDLDISNSVINGDFKAIPLSIANIHNRKIYLGLENVLMNMSTLGGCEHQSFEGLLTGMLRNNDEVIFETSNVYDPSNYTDGVEEVFHKYFEMTGLKDILGGKLRAETLDSTQKAIIIDEIKDKAEYNGRIYEFPRPKLTIRANFGDPMETDVFSQPYIFLGISQSLPRDEIFSVLMFNYLHDIILKKVDDWQFVGGQSVAKLVKEPNVRVSDERLGNLLTNTFMLTHSMDLKQLFTNLTDVMIGTGQYPAYYNALLTEFDYILEHPEMSSPVKYFLSQRAGKIDSESQKNMTNYIPKYLAGKEKFVEYDPFKGMNVEFHSLFDINLPR